ncbi:hypothetical protein IU418_18805 [Nocardia farcinica]|uniref:hypothetical protein n=1 Tax=Nocardia farcinica TaxID=37329 RepID=UPI001B3C655F|nr:hypothetical protein [Nocardia farcinica]MBF6539264.1 hypothetical protein [Nocardia farcinica]
MELPARRDEDDDDRSLIRAALDTGRYLQHEDGTWSLVGPDGWPVELDEFAELDADVSAALAAVGETAVDEDLLLRVRRGLLATIDVDPISVTDTELWRELER